MNSGGGGGGGEALQDSFYLSCKLSEFLSELQCSTETDRNEIQFTEVGKNDGYASMFV